jgi:type VI secretion system secreted protein VgrG
MILSAPNSIAVSSNENLYLSADGQISQSAGESINLSTQKSFIAHASEKISLFAAQDGLRAYAGKGKVEIQAQGDRLDVIARKGIQIISTEDTVYITSPTEINLTAGGSQIKMNGTGIFSTTAGKFESKAGQHQFLGSASVNVPAIDLPDCSAKQTQAAQNGSAKVDLS